MFVTTHAALGALVAEALPGNPLAAFLLGLATHFISDIIPHGDSHLYKGYVSGTKMRRAIAYVTIDGVIALFFSLFLLNTKLVDNQLATTWGIIGGVLPDALVGIYEVTRIRFLRGFRRFHFFFHNLVSSKRGDLSFSAGFSMQLIFLAALITRLV